VPSVVRTGELPKGPVDRLKEDSSRESKEPIRLKGDKERSCEQTSTRGAGEVCVSLVSEHRKISLLSVAGKRKTHHAAEKKR
jgi:hypothetical protein